jgi:mevalonate kinase
MVTRNITRAIKTADAYLKGSIGENYPVDNPKAKELALIIVSDLYDNRGLTTSGSVTNNTRRLVDDLSLQLRLELRRSVNNG